MPRGYGYTCLTPLLSNNKDFRYQVYCGYQFYLWKKPGFILQIYLNVLLFQYNGANIQLLDLPGIIEGAAQG